MPDEPAVTPVEGARSRLLKTVTGLDDSTCEVLESIVAGLNARNSQSITNGSDIVTPPFAKNFLTRLLLHHATHEEVFKKKTFEYAFKAASIVAGRRASMDQNVTSAGYDVKVDDTRYSLKTEAGAKTNRSFIKISKLMEARWIRECKNGQQYRSGLQAVLNHFTHYERVLTLRAFRVTTPYAGIQYDLVEIPLNLLKRIATLNAQDFRPPTSNGSTIAVVKTEGGEPAFRLRLDGSVEKVTLENLPISLCKKHASWTVETLIKSDDEE